MTRTKYLTIALISLVFASAAHAQAVSGQGATFMTCRADGISLTVGGEQQGKAQVNVSAPQAIAKTYNVSVQEPNSVKVQVMGGQEVYKGDGLTLVVKIDGFTGKTHDGYNIFDGFITVDGQTAIAQNTRVDCNYIPVPLSVFVTPTAATPKAATKLWTCKGKGQKVVAQISSRSSSIVDLVVSGPSKKAINETFESENPYTKSSVDGGAITFTSGDAISLTIHSDTAPVQDNGKSYQTGVLTLGPNGKILNNEPVLCTEVNPVRKI